MELVSLHILSDVEVKRHHRLHCKYFLLVPLKVWIQLNVQNSFILTKFNN